MSTEHPRTLDYEPDEASRTGVMSAIVVVMLSAVPGLGSLLLRGRSRLGWSLFLIFALGSVPIAAVILPTALFPYPSRAARYWSQGLITWGVPAGVLLLSIRRGLRDRAEVIAAGAVPAYRQGFRGYWPVAIAVLAIGVVVLALAALMLIALSGFAHAK